ncbi:MAG: 1-acyl-sn-glycerol-3-phosphate acyltransferase [Pseudomonadales bacterium]|nr:1-acyl-sn-glycerol-3-phosphate acyltransferase [Pseudomonadales bacterium]
MIKINPLKTLHLLVALLVPAVFGLLLGVSVALLTCSRRRGLNLMTLFLGKFGARLAGIKFEIKGSIVDQDRPCVFVFNHQSGLDPIILCHLIRKDVIALAKIELKNNPIIGPLLWFGETIFVDRIDPKKKQQIYAPAVAALKNGRSIAIAPEGKRVNHAAIGTFKHGAFKIAAQAGVPVIPIVIKDAKKCLPAKSIELHTGSIHIEILPPITANDLRKDIEASIERLESQYLEKINET